MMHDTLRAKRTTGIAWPAVASAIIVLVGLGPAAIDGFGFAGNDRGVLNPWGSAHPAPHSVLGSANPQKQSRDPYRGVSGPGIAPYRLSTLPLSSGSCPPGWSGNPAWLAYDDFNHTLWVAGPPSCVDVFNFTNGFAHFVAAIPVGSDPFGVAIDNATHEAYVTNTGSDNVTAISVLTDQVVAQIGVGTQPEGVAYDWRTGDLYVANNGSDNVTVISGATHAVVGALAAGSGPLGVAVDPASRQLFVANRWSDNVTVISDLTNATVASVPAGSQPYGVAVDNTTNTVYVTNMGSDSVTILNGTSGSVLTTLTTVVPAEQLQGLAYDPVTQLMWVGAGRSVAMVINTTSQTVAGYSSFDPSGVAYIPDNGDICVTNTDNFTLGCIHWPVGLPAASISFVESGLPSGTVWNVSMNQTGGYPWNQSTVVTSSSTITFWVLATFFTPPLLSYTYTIPNVNGFTASPASGTAVGGAQVDVTFSSPPATYPLLFASVGLPSGTSWSVTVGGTLGRSNSSTLAFTEPNGSYAFHIDPVAGRVPAPESGTVTVDGVAVEVPVSFAPGPPPPVLYTVEFNATGLGAGTVWTVVVNGSYRASAASTIPVALAAGTYDFAIGAVPGYELLGAPNGSLVVHSNLTIPVDFAPLFTVEFVEYGLAVGDPWSVDLGNQSGSTSGVVIVFSVVNGTYAYSVTAGFPALYSSSPGTGLLDVLSDLVVPVVFSLLAPPPPPLTYAVAFIQSGLPPGTPWTVVVNQTPVESTQGSAVLDLPNGSYAFVVAAPPGYVASPSSGQFQVIGGSVRFTVTFTGVAAPGTVPTGGTSYSAETLGLGIAGGLIAGAAAGLVVALVVRRRPPIPPP